MNESLKSTATSAALWSVVEMAGAQGAQLVIGIVLARLLLPEQFGLIGLMTIFFGVSQALLDSGFGMALIQKREPTHVDMCSIFYFNIMVGATAACLLCIAAPWVADFYHQPLLTPLMRFLSVTLVINALGLVQMTLLTKRIDFKSQAKVTIAATIISGVVGITLAFNGFGVWSIAVQQVCSAVLHTVLLWFFNSWRPSLEFSLVSLRQMFVFGSRMLVAAVLQQFFQSMYQAVIGKLYSAIDVGLYTRAVAMQEMPTKTLATVIGRVTMPVMASIQHDPQRLKRGMKHAITAMVFLNFPVIIGIAAVAHLLVLVLLTEKWLPSVPYLELLCLVGLIHPLHVVNLQLLAAVGRSDLFLKLTIFKQAMQIVALAITVSFSIEAILWGQVLISAVWYAVNSYQTAKLINYSVREQLRDISPYFGAALTMGAGVWMLPHVMHLAPPLLLAAQVALGALMYFILCAIFRLAAFVEGVATVKRKILPLWQNIAK